MSLRRPVFKTLMLARLGSILGQRPLCTSATPRGTSSKIATVYNDHGSSGFPQPVAMRVGCGRRWVCSPDQNAGGVTRRARVKAVQRRAECHSERDMPGLVADRIRVYFGRADFMKEAQREAIPDLRKCSCVMCLHHACPAGYG